MASSSLVLFEEQFHCSICLDVFTEPVTTPCGHNYCKACIRGYWDSTELCQCPMCKETFDRRPELRVNTFISEMAAQLKTLAPVEATTITKANVQTTIMDKQEVSCDVCTKEGQKALKSCLVCLASFCETHLEHHRILASLKKHKLIDPVSDLENRVCKKHERPLELFCTRDQICVCQFCFEADHKTHKTVPVEEEYGKRKAELEKTKGKVQNMIEERQQKINALEQAVNEEGERAHVVQVFTTLLKSIERNQADLLEELEVKQKAAEKQSESFIKELECEITELQTRGNELEQFSKTEDHLLLLHSFQSLCFTITSTKNWSKISAHSGLSVGTVRRAVSALQEILNKEMEKLCDVELKRVQQFAVDVTLDPDTAHPFLILSENRKQVSYGNRQHLPAKPERFDNNPRVLGKEAFFSGRFYYEVQVKEKERWVVGVARESINRKQCDIEPRPADGYWTVGRWNFTEYRAYTGPLVNLYLRVKPQKVGVFVDYEEGEVSFYNVEDRSHIYSFTGCSFNGKLSPFFSTSTDTAPLVISSVNSF